MKRILRSTYWPVLAYTAIGSLVVGFQSWLLSIIALGHYNPLFALVPTPLLAVIGYCWLKDTLDELREDVGRTATAYGYNAGYRDCYNDDDYERMKHLDVIDLDEALQEK